MFYLGFAAGGTLGSRGLTVRFCNHWRYGTVAIATLLSSTFFDESGQFKEA
ncbi:hypothetical protein QG37_06176 [Candidozyma auris]|nr:hypothetical protein QG37_06176 [[Candida] auris]